MGQVADLPYRGTGSLPWVGSLCGVFVRVAQHGREEGRAEGRGMEYSDGVICDRRVGDVV